jgi:flavorubredoxin
MAQLLSGMQSAGVDMTGGSAPTDEMKKKLRELGIEVYKKGGKVKMSSASKRADGCATKGKTRGKMV